MRRLYFLLAIILALASVSILTAPSQAGWGTGGCSNGSCSPPAAVAAQGFTGWNSEDKDPHQMGYYVNGAQVGYYNARKHLYWPLVNGEWGVAYTPSWAPMTCRRAAKAANVACPENCPCDACECGCECPKGAPCGDGRCSCLVAKTAKAVGDIPNFGLDLSKIGESGEKSSINGHTVTKRQLLQALGDPVTGDAKIPDDAGLLRLTIVADDKAALATLKATLKPLLGDLNERLVIQWYTKDNWAIRPGYGFRFDALPAVLLQEPEKPGKKGGKALFQASLSSNPAPVVAAVRAKIDAFDPKKVPGLSGDPVTIPPAAALGVIALLAAGFLVFKK